MSVSDVSLIHPTDPSRLLSGSTASNINDSRSFLSFKLSEEFVSAYVEVRPDWRLDIGGGNSLSELTFYAKYSRVKEDGGKERWYEVVQRCVEGMFSIFLDNAIENNLDISWITQELAEEAFDRMFHFKWTPAGRQLWMLGTEFVHGNRNGAPLSNCSVLTSDPDEYDSLSGPFTHFMAECFLGIGVSFDLNAAGKIFLYSPLPSNNTFVIPDSREGWCKSIRLLLDSYFYHDKEEVHFDYSEIRPAGAPIKGFGGTASGPASLRKAHNIIREILNAKVDNYIDTKTVLDIFNILGKCIVSGGARRSASLALGDIDDDDFISAKNWQLPENEYRIGEDGFAWMSNNSVRATVGMDYGPIIDNIIVNGEPGLLYIEESKAQGRVGDFSRPDPGVINFNPCVTGDTQVAVADGRGSVPIKDLADEGADVPVYSFDPSAKRVVIRMMRHPRKTGENRRVLKVTLDSGDVVRVTPNHKFILRDGSEVKAGDLRGGESLRLMTRAQKPYASTQTPYWHVEGELEHRLVSEFHEGVITNSMVVHHRDHNPLNNEPENLQRMGYDEHLRYHSRQHIGEKNAMYRGFVDGEFGEGWQKAYSEKMSKAVSGEANGRFSGFGHNEIRDHAKALCIELGRRPSLLDWEAYATKHGLPKRFSGWRKHHLNGGIIGLLVSAAIECGFENVDADPRIVKTYGGALEQGYDASIINGCVWVRKQCEICDTSFERPWGQREVALCSKECVAKSQSNISRPWPDKARASIEARQAKTREQQVKVYIDCNPDTMKQFKLDCQKNGVSPEIGRKGSPFKKWGELLEAAENYNHKVVSVEHDGFEDVYNGTVDEFHTFFTGGWEGETNHGLPKQHFILNRNCGEIGLEAFEKCLLAELYPTRNESKEDLVRSSLFAYLCAKASVIMPTPWPKVNETLEKNRRIGVSLTGIVDFISSGHSIDDLKEWASDTYEALEGFDKTYSSLASVAQSIKLTCIKPAGTTALIAGTTSGIHYPVQSGQYLRRNRFHVTDPLVKLLEAAGYRVEPDLGDPEGTVVVTFAILSFAHVASEREVSLQTKMELAATMAECWADNAVSATFTFGPEEARSLERHIKMFEGRLKTMSFLPLHEEGAPYAQMPFEKADSATILGHRQVVPIDIDSLYNGTYGAVDAIGDKYCTGDACEIPLS